jgi:ABC-type phosphate transport system substrate-binding protein
MMRRPILLGVAVLGLAGCGVSTDGAIHQLGQKATTSSAARAAVAAASLPLPVSGEATIDGVLRGSLTSFAAQDYEQAGGTTRVTIDHSGEKAAFGELCSGKIDMVDSSRAISSGELAACRAAGLTPVQFQVASDAVVIATKAETDVGADCLTVAGVRELYRAGSPVYDWSQLGFSHVPLEVGGPGPSNNDFSYFGRAVLGAAQPSLTDLRSDYHAGASDADSRRFVTGNAADAQIALQRQLLSGQLAAQRIRVSAASTSRGEAIHELSAARADQAKGIRDHRSAAAQQKASQRTATAKTALARARASYAAAEQLLVSKSNGTAAATAAARRQAEVVGRVSYFRFSYYELFEDQLRPLEISAADGAGRSCVFPSQQTITDGSYPLARQLLITTTTAAMKRSEVQTFLLSYLRRARDLATTHRLVPLPEATLAQEEAWIAGTTPVPPVLTTATRAQLATAS